MDGESERATSGASPSLFPSLSPFSFSHLRLVLEGFRLGRRRHLQSREATPEGWGRGHAGGERRAGRAGSSRRRDGPATTSRAGGGAQGTGQDLILFFWGVFCVDALVRLAPWGSQVEERRAGGARGGAEERGAFPEARRQQASQKRAPHLLPLSHRNKWSWRASARMVKGRTLSFSLTTLHTHRAGGRHGGGQAAERAERASEHSDF